MTHREQPDFLDNVPMARLCLFALRRGRANVPGWRWGMATLRLTGGRLVLVLDLICLDRRPGTLDGINLLTAMALDAERNGFHARCMPAPPGAPNIAARLLLSIGIAREKLH